MASKGILSYHMVFPILVSLLWCELQYYWLIILDNIFLDCYLASLTL